MPLKIDRIFHHRRSIRLKGYNYSTPGAYFVTICTKNREFLFGDVTNGNMVLNDTGRVAERFWREIPQHYPDVTVDVYVVMPNHVHGIIIIDNAVGANNYSPLHHDSLLQKRPHGTSKTVGAIVRGYKIGMTKWARQNTGKYNVWQRNYYEYVIRNEHDLNRLRQYILQNPAHWAQDQENPRKAPH